ncbi:MAG TPA: hypothetical protein VMS86_06210, partial [Thermoanaerobaculia bacterium]|nr:hypothetical protein [Thermoanaerobaculia bacterium]
EHGYLLDPHTAVGWLAIQALRAEHAGSPGIVLATAHPAKFPAAVEAAAGIEIELPPALAEPMSRPETVEAIPAEDDALRRFLLSIQDGEHHLRS